MTRVALLHPVYWPEVRRGAERMTRELADGLAARGHVPRILTSHPGRPSRGVEDGVEVVRGWRAPDGRLRRRLYEEYLTSIPPAALALARGDDDVAVALHTASAVAAGEWSRRTGRPMVLAYMGIPAFPWIAARRGRAALTARALRDAAAVTALSEAAAAAMERWLGARARVIPPGVDVEAFRPGGERAAAPTVVCAADAREPRKRVALLVEAFARVRRERPGARLVLDRATAAGFADPAAGIELAAMDERAELAALYRSAWVSVLPSVGEAFGLVLAEALACGTPVAGSDRDGIPEVLGGDERVGRLFAGDEPEPLARALLEAIELAREPSTALACRARAESLSTARTAAAYEAVFTELGAGARA